MRKLFLASALSFALALPAIAQVKVEDAWVRGTVPQQRATGAFMLLTAERDVRLLAAQTPVAGVAEIHEMVMDNDVMKMRELPELPLPAGQTVELKPGGYHVMLMELEEQMVGGKIIPITLTFEDAEGQRFEQVVEAAVAPLGAARQEQPAMGQQDHQQHGGHGK